MIRTCHVRAKLFWEALIHCVSPVYLNNQADVGDLRDLPERMRETILPSRRKLPSVLTLRFADGQDYARFVLAYLLREEDEA